MAPFPSLITIVPEDGSLREEEWAEVECRSKTAHGCGPAGQAVVDGLMLLTRVAGSGRSALRSDLAITVSGEALCRLGDTEVDEDRWGRATDLYLSHTKVEAVDKDAAVFTVWFANGYGLFLYYYLVYDSGAASLSMIPHLRWEQCSACYMDRPVLVRHGGGDGSHYSIVLMARHQGEPKMDVVCLWPPPPSACGHVGPWGMKEISPKCPSDFNVDVAFTARGRAFWTDLASGVLHCDLRALLDGGGPVEFKSTKLPPGYRFGYLQTIEMGARGPHRTMGVAGDSDRIRFVSIDRASARIPGPDRIALARIFNEEHEDPEQDDLDSDPDDDYVPSETEQPCPGDTIVTVWTLDESLRRWSKDVQLHLASEIWGLPKFEEAGLPRSLPVWPFLRPREEEEQEDDGGAGVLYFLLSKNPTRGGCGPCGYYICRVNMRDGGEAIRLVSRHLPTQWVREPLYLPPGLFNCLDPCKVEAKSGRRKTRKQK